MYANGDWIYIEKDWGRDRDHFKEMCSNRLQYYILLPWLWFGWHLDKLFESHEWKQIFWATGTAYQIEMSKNTWSSSLDPK